jgi:NADP-dependent 3-hydroxy acid dehydrogenase YdfG
LLGKAKDNNAAAAIGPFIRLFDGAFTLDDVRSAKVGLEVRGEDGFVMTGESSMSLISRDPLDLIGQTHCADHQYPDGFALYLGTMFAPIDDRDAPGGASPTSRATVRVSSERLGALTNKVTVLRRTGAALDPGHLRPDEKPGRPRSDREPPHDRAIYPSLKDRLVVITGGGSGIGAGHHRRLRAPAGAGGVHRRRRKDSRALEASLATLSPAPTLQRLRPARPRPAQGLPGRSSTAHGPIDVLVNNAANDDRHPEEVTPAYWDERMAVNLRHLYFASQAVAPGCAPAGAGVILNLGSISWHLGLADLSLYEIAKAGIEGMTRALARDLGVDNSRLLHRAGQRQNPAPDEMVQPRGRGRDRRRPMSRRPHRAERHRRHGDVPGLGRRPPDHRA